MKRWQDSGRGTDAIARKTLAAIERGVSALETSQHSNGSWLLSKKVGVATPTPASGLFSTTAVLLSAGSLLKPSTVSRAIDFIQSCRHESGQWSFDPTMNVPCDVDDTACALACLARFRPTSVSSRDIDLLSSYWRNESGTFRTWDVNAPEEFWADQETDDPIVNCNVMMALAELGSAVDPDTTMAVQQFVARRPTSRYYAGTAVVLHSAVRAGIEIGNVRSLADPRPSKKWDSLQLAFWLAAQSTVDFETIKVLLRDQTSVGLWPYSDWCTGTFETPTFWGSAPVTTAVVLEALHRQAQIWGWQS